MAAEFDGFLASSNINPSRFVNIVSGSRGYVQQSTASTPYIGISQEGTQEAPGTTADSGYAATDGRPLKVYAPGRTCLLKLGGTVSAGDRLTADASGQGVKYTAGTALQYFGAVALDNGSSGNLIRVLVWPFEAVTA